MSNLKNNILDNVTLKMHALINEHGLANITKQMLCDECDISPPFFTKVVGVTFKEFVNRYHLDGVKIYSQDRNRSRMLPRFRREFILTHSLQEARDCGAGRITISRVARRASVSRATISHYFGDVITLRKETMRLAVSELCLDVVCKDLKNKDPITSEVPEHIIGLARRSLNLTSFL